MPSISVGMPVYNGEQYLELSIKATLAQSFDDFELIISDNASTDRTEEICRDYLSRDKRIKYIKNIKNIGAAGNFNQVFEKSSGKYFRWFSADDLCSDNLHAKCIAVLEDNLDAVMSYGKTSIIDGDGNFIEDYDDNLNLQQESVFDRFSTYLRVAGLMNAQYGLMRKSALTNTALMGNGSYPDADVVFLAELSL